MCGLLGNSLSHMIRFADKDVRKMLTAVRLQLWSKLNYSFCLQLLLQQVPVSFLSVQPLLQALGIFQLLHSLSFSSWKCSFHHVEVALTISQLVQHNLLVLCNAINLRSMTIHYFLPNDWSEPLDTIQGANEKTKLLFHGMEFQNGLIRLLCSPDLAFCMPCTKFKPLLAFNGEILPPLLKFVFKICPLLFKPMNQSLFKVSRTIGIAAPVRKLYLKHCIDM